MQRDVFKKAFTFHERFVLEIDPSERFIKGLAELTIHPLHNKLTNIRLNCRQCKIVKALVNGIPVEFTYSDAVSELTLGSNTTIAHHQVYKSRYLNALRDANEGELSVKLPLDCIQQISDSEAQVINNAVFLQTQTAIRQPTADEALDKTNNEVVYAPITVRIEYTLEDPRNGLVFVQKDDEIAPYRSNHVYTVNQPLPGATRAWLPCIDRVSERCTWDMEFIVPRKEGGAPIPEYDGEGSFEEKNGITVVCSGEVLEQVIHPTDPSKKIVHYSLSVPTPAPFIGFAVGPFEMIKLSPSQLQEEVMNATDLDENQQQSLMAEINMMSNIYAFALPGSEEVLSISCSFLMHAMHFFTQEYGSYPFSDYKVVFVEDAWADTASSASLAICSSRLLHPVDIIDQIYNTRRELSQALAQQWFGIHIVQKSWPDTWLVRGLANLIGSLFIKRHLGNNEHRLRLKKDMELCCMLDVNRPPVYNPALPYPLDPEDLEFIDLKAPLVLYMLDKRMCKGGGTLGLSRVLPKILVSAMSGELAQNAISTHYFLRLCRKVSGFDTKIFAEQWIYKSGCPKFSFSFNFNRKKMVVEIFMKQENTNSSLNADSSGSIQASQDGAVGYQDFMTPLFTGNLTVRIHEADGTPYEHILDIQSNKHKFEVQFNTKYKRIRRNTKRFLAKQAAAAAAVAEEEQENEENGEGTTVLGIIPSLGLGMPIFEDPTQKKEWKVIEWGQDEEDTSGAASAMFDWIRLDAEFEWLCICEFKQPDYMWAAQLTKDRDVVAQHEAIEALKHMPSLATSTSLLRAILDQKCFYKIRMEAAYGLSTCATESLDWVGLHQLSKMFNKRYCFPVSQFQMEPEDGLPFVSSIPKPNNFSNLPDYFIQKASIVAFSQIRDERGLTPVRIRQFLLDLLKYNDNIGNEFSDCYYVATLVSALGDSLIPVADSPSEALQNDDFEGEQVTAAAKAEIERFRTLDYVIPSYHNIITVTCLRTMTKLMLKDLLPINLGMFMQYTRYGNYLEVRLAAFDSLFILCGLSDDTLNQYLLSVIRDDPCVYISHYAARAMLAWLGLAMKENLESSTTSHRFVEEFAEEEGRVVIDDERQPLKKTAQHEFQESIETLRKRFENDTTLQQALWNLLNSSENSKLDHSIRKYLLQFCEYMFKPIDVGLKVTIRVPTLQPHDMVDDTSEPPTPTQSIIRINKPKARPEDKPSKPKKNTVHIKKESISDLPLSITSSTTTTPVVESPKTTPTSTAVQSTPQSPTPPPSNLSTPSATAPPTVTPPTTTTITPASTVPAKRPAPAESSSSTLVKVPKVPKTPKTPKAPKASTTVTKPSAKTDSPTVTVKPPRPVVTEPAEPATKSYPHQPSTSAAAPKHKHKSSDGVVDDLKKCKRIFNRINKQDAAFYFCHPVDEAADNAPNYYQIIKYPMNLAMIKSKLENKEYKTIAQFESDFRLMLNNCYQYNSPGTYVYNEGQTLEAIFEKELANITGPPRDHDEAQNRTIVESPRPPASATAPPSSKPKPKPVPSSSHTSPALATSTSSSKSAPSPVAVERRKSSTPSAPTSVAPVPTPPSAPQKQPSATPTTPSSVPERKPEREKTEREKMMGILSRTIENRHAFEFLRPVDPIKQGIPHYTTIIKTPMDLGKIKSRFKNDQYTSATQMDDDMRLMFNNCYTFNPPDTYVYNEAKQLEEAYNKEWRSNFGKRRSSTSSSQKSSSSSPIKVKSNPTKTVPHKAPAETSSPVPKPVSKPQPSSSSPVVQPSEPAKAPPVKIKAEKPKSPTVAATTNGHSSKSSESKSVEKPKTKLVAAMDANNKKRCQRIMNKLWQHQGSQSFYEPVDAVALNVPQYYELIKRPMDLGTIRKALEKDKYTSIWSYEKDIRQIFWNCYSFNHPESWVVEQARGLETFFNQIFAAEFSEPNALKGEDRRLAQKVVNKLTLHDAAALFNEPVDMDSLPGYSDIVKRPMDLRTIWERLESGKYTSLKALDQDIRQVFKNCFDFNDASSFGSAQGKKLEKYYQNISKEIRARIAATKPVSTPGSPSSSIPAKRAHPSESSSKHPVKLSKPVDTTKSPSRAESERSTSQEAPSRMHPTLTDRLESFLKRLMNNKAAMGFLEPVDPIALNIPHYTAMIQKPMDFGTMLKKLRAGQYKTVRDYESDMKLIFTNCYSFNGFDHVLSKNAMVLENILKREAPLLHAKEEELRHGKQGGDTPVVKKAKPAPSVTISPEKAELRKYRHVLDKLAHHPAFYAFGAPVDPVLLKIPTYFDIIKRPMDFGTIRKKFDKNRYETANDLLADVKQVFVNCYLFNVPDDVVSKMGKELETEFIRLCKAKDLPTIQVSRSAPTHT